MSRLIAGLIAVSFAAGAAAQSAPPVPPEKKAQVERVLARMSMESVALDMLQKPIANEVAQARVLAQSRIPADKRDAVLKDIAMEATKTFDDEAPLVRASAKKAVDTNVAPLLAQRFTADELKQLADIMESPVLAKFEQITPELKKAVGESVARANGPQVNAKLTELQNKIGLRLRSAIAQ